MASRLRQRTGDERGEMKTELKRDKVLFLCEVCGKRKKLDSGKRHWCDCNPSAPFYFVEVRLKKMIGRLLGSHGLRTTNRRDGHRRRNFE